MIHLHFNHYVVILKKKSFDVYKPSEPLIHAYKTQSLPIHTYIHTQTLFGNRSLYFAQGAKKVQMLTFRVWFWP